MKFVSGNPDLSTQAKYAAIVETCAGVDHHGGTIDPRGESVSRTQVTGHDRIGMVGPVLVDMISRLVQGIDYLDTNDRAQVLGRPVLLVRRDSAVDQVDGDFIGPNFDTIFNQTFGNHGYGFAGDVSMNQQRLAGVANSHPLAFGVFDDPSRHLDRGRLIDIDVAIPIKVLDHRHGCLVGNAPNQSLPTAWYCDIDELTHRQKMTDGITIGRFDQLNRMLGNSAIFGTGRQDIHDRATAMNRLFTTP